MCSKSTFTTYEQAEEVARRIKRRKEQKGVNPYRCPVCGYWHIGHASKKGKRHGRLQL